MIVKQFIFNAFSENTYVIHNDNEAIIIDAGNSNLVENQILDDYIESNNLKAIRLINTHFHIDHILGNKYIYNKYNLSPEGNKNDEYNLEYSKLAATNYGIPYEESPPILSYLEDGDTISLGDESMTVIATPGHSFGSISFYNAKDKFIISGDVIFQGSIGRTDLPKGNYDILMSTIKEKIFTLPSDVIIYSGHGDLTSVGVEKNTNPFFN